MSYLTSKDWAYRYLAGEANVIQKHLDLDDITVDKANKLMTFAVSEARRLYLKDDTIKITWAISRSGRITLNNF